MIDAHLEIKDKQGLTALAYAVAKGDSQAVGILLQGGVVVEDKEEAVIYAACRGMIEITQMLLKAGADIKQAAFAATKHGQYYIVRKLLETGLAPDTTLNGRSLLQEANEVGFKEIEAMLRSAGASIAPLSVFTIESPQSEGKKAEKTVAAFQASLSNVETELISVQEAYQHRNSPLLGYHDQRSPRQDFSPASPNVETRSETPIRKHDLAVQPNSATRVGAGTIFPSPYLLLRYPIMASSLKLGAIVVDPHDPLDVCLPRDMEILDEIVPGAEWLTTSDMDLSENFDKPSSGRTQSLVDVGNNLSREGKLDMATRQVVHNRLQNHAEVLSRLVVKCETEISQLLDRRKKMHFVVGLMSTRDLAASRSRDSEVAGSESVCVGPSLSAFTNTSTSTTQRFEGTSIILGIHYRVLKFRRCTIPAGSGRKVWSLDLGDYLILKPHERVI